MKKNAHSVPSKYSERLAAISLQSTIRVKQITDCHSNPNRSDVNTRLWIK